MTLPEMEAALKELRQKQESFERHWNQYRDDARIRQALADGRHDQLRADVDDWFTRIRPIVEANAKGIGELRHLIESYIRSIHNGKKEN